MGFGCGFFGSSSSSKFEAAEEELHGGTGRRELSKHRVAFHDRDGDPKLWAEATQESIKFGEYKSTLVKDQHDVIEKCQANEALVNAAHCSKRASIACYEKAAHSYYQMKHLAMAAKNYKEAAKMYKSAQEFDKATDLFIKAGDLFARTNCPEFAEECEEEAELCAEKKEAQDEGLTLEVPESVEFEHRYIRNNWYN